MVLPMAVFDMFYILQSFTVKSRTDFGESSQFWAGGRAAM
jgi:hypothetical protein